MVDTFSATPVGFSRTLTGLLVGARLWATGRPVDAERLQRYLDEALLLQHARYVAMVPLYRRLALELGHDQVTDAGILARDLLVGTAYFKSYEEAALANCDFASLTRWVREASTLDCWPDLTGVTDVEGWRAALRRIQVYVGLSSGSTGRPSFVPRDAATLSALSSNGRSYSILGWGGFGASTPDYDCLLLSRPGRRSGIESVATGLAELATRSAVISPEVEDGSETDAAVSRAAGFVAEVRTAGRRLLIFGTPPALRWLCDAIEDRWGRLPLPPSTLIVTGGGWKASAPDGLVLEERMAQILDVPAAQTTDVYGMSECNAYLTRCSHGRYHVPPVLRAVVLDEALNPRDGDDAAGQIGLLDPFAFSYPGFLLTGDEGRLVQAGCECGLSGPGFVGGIARAARHESKGCANAPVGTRA